MDKDAALDNLISDLLALYAIALQEMETNEKHKTNPDKDDGQAA
jgi:hypothetical protein